jgi:hypothetical protein
MALIVSPTVDEIRRTAEARLRELAPVLAEAEQLRLLLAAIDTPAPAGAPAPPRLSAVQPLHPTARRQRDGRAPQGANKQLILDIVAHQPGVAAPEIAAATGLKRTVVASTISRLKRIGELEAHGRGVRLPHTAAVA